MALAVAPISSADVFQNRLNSEDRHYVETYDYDNYECNSVNNGSKCLKKCCINTLIVSTVLTILMIIAYCFSSYFDSSDYDSYYSVLIGLLIFVCISITLIVIIRSSNIKFCWKLLLLLLYIYLYISLIIR